jgi:YfiH family protein
MLRKNNKGVYTFTTFSDFKTLVCAFSTASFGNMKPSRNFKIKEVERNRNKFFDRLSLKNSSVVTTEQVHGGRVSVVTKKDAGREIKGADALVTREENLLLMVFVADCLPIVAYDPKKEIVGIAHAGWKGTTKKIAGNLIKTFAKLGSNPKDILVGLGPGIEFCHYGVGQDVAKRFVQAGFGEAILKSVSGKILADLKSANIKTLTEAGVNKRNIDASLKICTYETDDFYSFRRGDNGNRIAALVGLKNGN